MTPFAALLQQGAAYAWLFVPSAVLLGALHGLEPGHSKTMMAAFIVAVRGTVKQAVLLGLAATFSHTLVVWGVVLAGMYLWRGVDAEAVEPYFQLASAVMIIGVALWMLTRVWREGRCAKTETHDHHDHSHDHDHAHGSAGGHDISAAACGHHDAHTLAHADDIRRFAGRDVTNGQIILFGLTGGLMPCPAAITVLLLCLQLKEIALGVVLVLCFSIGLALTLVAVGVAAAMGLGHAAKRYPWFEAAMRRAPYVSGAVILMIGAYVGLHGWQQLASRMEE